MANTSRLRPIGLTWRVGLIGIAYLLLLALGGALLTSLGARPPQVEGSSKLLPWILLSGILIGLVLGSVANQMSATYRRHAYVWSSLLFFNSVAVLFEGLFFAPDYIKLENAPFLMSQQLLVSIGTSILITYLFAPRSDETTANGNSHQAWYALLWRIAASVFTYVLLFFVVGGLNYSLVTRPFYEQQGFGLATPEFPIVLSVEIVRGAIIVASILPFIRTFRTTKRGLMILTGLLLFVVGGVVPLMMQATTLPGFLLLASGWEIFFQLFPTGMVSTALLGR